MEQNNNQFWTIPNVLTLVRLLLIPVVVLLAVRDQMIWGGVTFILVCMTDLLDGYIARKYHMVSKVGIWLDPVADGHQRHHHVYDHGRRAALGYDHDFRKRCAFAHRRRAGAEKRQFHALGYLWQSLGIFAQYLYRGRVFPGIFRKKLFISHVCRFGACHFGIYTVCYYQLEVNISKQERRKRVVRIFIESSPSGARAAAYPEVALELAFPKRVRKDGRPRYRAGA